MPAYHYTSSWHLPWILVSGALVESRQKIAGFPSPDFIWATTSPRGDLTATVQEGFRHGKVKLVRLEFAESEFFPWAEVLQRYPEWTERHVYALERVARASDIKNWLCRSGELPLSSVRAIDVRTYTDNSWRPVTDREVRLARNGDGSQWLAMRLLGDVEASSRTTMPDGGSSLSGGELAARFETLPIASSRDIQPPQKM